MIPTYKVEWSDEDGAYVATVDADPSLSCRHFDADTALRKLKRMVAAKAS